MGDGEYEGDTMMIRRTCGQMSARLELVGNDAGSLLDLKEHSALTSDAAWLH